MRRPSRASGTLLVRRLERARGTAPRGPSPEELLARAAGRGRRTGGSGAPRCRRTSSKNQPQLVYMSCACRCSLEELQAAHPLRRRQRRGRRARARKRRDALGRAVEDHVDVVVARRPRVRRAAPAAPRLAERRQRVAQRVERLAQRRPPGLVPARVRARVAAAVALPALDAVGAAPGRALDDPRLVRRRVLAPGTRRSWSARASSRRSRCVWSA